MVGSAKQNATAQNSTALAVSGSLQSLVILAAVPTGAQAQTFNGFGFSFQHEQDDQGLNPSVASYNGIVVEVQNGTAGAGPLLYRVGQVNAQPAGALNAKLVESPIRPPPLGQPITWSDAQQFEDNGYNPSVAVAGSTVVEVHNGGAGPGPLWYRMGTLNGTTLSWKDSHQFDSYSTNPSVAATACGDGTSVCVLEVHNDNGAPGPLWYRYGSSTDGSTISWQTRGVQLVIPDHAMGLPAPRHTTRAGTRKSHG